MRSRYLGIAAAALAALYVAGCQPETSGTTPVVIESPTVDTTAASGEMTAVPQTPSDAADARFTAPLTATLRFTAPEFGSVVTSPVTVCLEVDGVAIEPSGAVSPNSGHHHIIVDPTPEDLQSIFGGGGAAIPKDDRRLHLGDGGACKSVALSSGKHVLIGIVADGAHIPLNPPIFNQLNLEVK